MRAAFRKILGYEIVLLNLPQPGTWASSLVKFLGSHEVRLETMEHVLLAPESYAAPVRAALRIAKSRVESLPHQELDSTWTTPPLIIALARSLSNRSQEITNIDAWARKPENIALHVPTRDMKAVLREMKTPARISVPLISFRFRLRTRSLRTKIGTQDSVVGVTGSTQSADYSRGTSAKAMLILNRDIKYAQAFSYEELLPTELDSPWSTDNVAYVSKEGGKLANGAIASPLPTPRSQASIARNSLPLIARSLVRAGKFSTLWQRHVLNVRTNETATYFRQAFPTVRAALLAFDVQVPTHVVLGLEAAGIRTVALQERPALAFDSSATSIAGRMLAASVYFQRQLTDSANVSCKSIAPVGLWRSDLLRRELSKADDSSHACHPLVLVLPYHLESEGEQATDPVCNSAESITSFLNDIARLAARYPAIKFVVRAKNDVWLSDYRMQLVRKALQDCGNIEMNSDYRRLNHGYELAARSSLIIAKPTSFVDEALSCGIPCILHDFTHNHADHARTLLTYFPRDLWASNFEQLRDKFDSVIEDLASARMDLEPIRNNVYGNMADGRVLHRIHSELHTLTSD